MEATKPTVAKKAWLSAKLVSPSATAKLPVATNTASTKEPTVVTNTPPIRASLASTKPLLLMSTPVAAPVATSTVVASTVASAEQPLTRASTLVRLVVLSPETLLLETLASAALPTTVTMKATATTRAMATRDPASTRASTRRATTASTTIRATTVPSVTTATELLDSGTRDPPPTTVMPPAVPGTTRLLPELPLLVATGLRLPPRVPARVVVAVLPVPVALRLGLLATRASRTLMATPVAAEE